MLGLVLLLGGCAWNPVLYPNAHLNEVGQERAKRDIDDCRQRADAYVKSDAAKTIAKDTVIGGVGGAVVGGAVGAVRGSFGSGLGTGAAGGAAAGLVTGAIKASGPSDVYKGFVNRCLRDKGYEVIGWE
ncbi:MAG: cell envelope biogenesis protein OmpA [Pseudomonadota bacterium]|nr:cell envelope biogenesis protein OmpA [Pseudomonadota bacterium]